MLWIRPLKPYHVLLQHGLVVRRLYGAVWLLLADGFSCPASSRVLDELVQVLRNWSEHRMSEACTLDQVLPVYIA